MESSVEISTDFKDKDKFSINSQKYQGKSGFEKGKK